MEREGTGRRGGGQERPTLRVESEGKSCPRPARGAARVARRRRRRREAAGGAASGPGCCSGSRPGAQLRPELPGPRPAASTARRPAQRGLVPTAKLSLGKASGRRAARTQAPPGRRWGTRVHAAPLRRARGPARSRPPASEGRCPGPAPDAGPRPSRGRTPKADKQ